MAENWQVLQEFSDRGSAEAVAGILQSESVPARIEASGLVGGVERRFKLLVAESFMHRARWVLSQSEFTDSELDYLATGDLAKD